MLLILTTIKRNSIKKNVSSLEIIMLSNSIFIDLNFNKSIRY